MSLEVIPLLPILVSCY